MKSILNSRKKTSSSINLSRSNGTSSKPNKFFYLFSLFITNLFVYFISSGPSQDVSRQPLKLQGYSEVVVHIELKTPFETGKKISLYSSTNQKTYSEIYFFSQYDEPQAFETTEINKYVIYVPNKIVSELAQSSKLIAIPYQSIIKTVPQRITQKDNYEIVY